MKSKLDRCEREQISSLPRTFSQFFNDRTPTSRRTRGRARNHSMQHCEQTWNGTAKLGDPTGRKISLHHLHNNGGNTNTKTLNGKINIGGKSDGYRFFQSHVDLFFSQVSRTDISGCRARDGEWRQNTLSHVHLSLYRALDHRSSHAPACGFSSGCVAPLRILQVIHSQHVSSTTP